MHMSAHMSIHMSTHMPTHDWQSYGYTIVKALVTDLQPAPQVMAAMNEINTVRLFLLFFFFGGGGGAGKGGSGRGGEKMGVGDDEGVDAPSNKIERGECRGQCRPEHPGRSPQREIRRETKRVSVGRVPVYPA